MSWKRHFDFVLDSLDGLSYLVFPETCPACMSPLNKGEKCLCTSCRFRLPRTQYYRDDQNPVFKHFWGKVHIEGASAYYHFGKGEKVQRLIHHLKYKGRKDVGEFTGELFGYEIMNTQPFSAVNLIVPVPLHPAKLRIRGYNQSECFAEGIAKAMGVSYHHEALLRLKATDTQTRKHRYERYENVNKVFSVPSPELVAGKHILLVDDVITTGSTFIACAEELLSIPGTKVSIGALACA